MKKSRAYAPLKLIKILNNSNLLVTLVFLLYMFPSNTIRQNTPL